MTRHRGVMWAVAAFVAALVLIGAFAAFTMLSIAHDLKRAQSMIESASAEIHDGRLTEARGNLDGAERILISANGRLYGQTQFDLLGWVPGVNQNLTSLRRSVALALTMVHGGGDLLKLTLHIENQEVKLEVSMSHGAIPLDLVQQVERQA